MHPSIPLVLFLGFAGCVSLQALRPTVADVLDAQGAIVEGINGLDTACQSRATNDEELRACREPRDRARAGLRKQVESLSHLGGVR